jgi:hypothetical protein
MEKFLSTVRRLQAQACLDSIAFHNNIKAEGTNCDSCKTLKHRTHECHWGNNISSIGTKTSSCAKKMGSIAGSDVIQTSSWLNPSGFFNGTVSTKLGGVK